jgi:hypothetical protein
MPTYRLFGVVIETDHALRANPSTAEPELRIRTTEVAPAADWRQAEERHADGPVCDGRPAFRYFSLPDRNVVRIEGAADFHIEDAAITIHVRHPEHRYVVPIALYGLVFAFWLERRGRTALHGSAVEIRHDSAVAFLGAGGAGKSSMAAALVAAGAPLISEDLLAIGPPGPAVVEPGLAQLRLWPEQLVHHRPTDWQGLEQPHPDFAKRLLPIGDDGLGTLAADPVPLAAVFVLDRVGANAGPPAVEQLEAPHSLVELIRHSYLPVEAQRFGWQADRFGRLADLLHHVPVRRLRYPSGVDELPAVRAAITAALDR